MSTNDTLLEIIGHLGAAQIQRAPSDDKIIAEHIDAALALAQRLRLSLIRIYDDAPMFKVTVALRIDHEAAP